MIASVPEVAPFKLTDLLSSAGSTIGIIIAGAIFLQLMNSRFMDLASRYRTLTGEYRGGKAAEARHAPLQAQIRRYRRRLRLIDGASWLAAGALLCFLTAILAGGLGMAFPGTPFFKWLGAGGLFFGVCSMMAAVLLHLAESIGGRQELGEEVADLDEDVKSAGGN